VSWAGEVLGMGGVCGIGAFFDDMVNDIVGLDGLEETVIYMATVGRPRKGEENSSPRGE
jgi:hypothetical protein